MGWKVYRLSWSCCSRPLKTFPVPVRLWTPGNRLMIVLWCALGLLIVGCFFLHSGCFPCHLLDSLKALTTRENRHCFWHCLHSMQSRVCVVIWCLSVSSINHICGVQRSPSSRSAAAVYADSVTFTAVAWGLTRTCLISHTDCRGKRFSDFCDVPVPASSRIVSSVKHCKLWRTLSVGTMQAFSHQIHSHACVLEI